MRKISMGIDAPAITPGSGIIHISTSWQVSKIPDFTKQEYIVVESLNDELNLLSYKFRYDIKPNEPLYLRTKIHFNNDLEFEWSKIVPLHSDQIGIKLSSTVINTPRLEVNLSFSNNLNGYITVNTSIMSLYGGAGVHNSTSWFIADTDGKVVFDRQKDLNNLTTIKLPVKIFDKNKIYTIKARHHTDTNADSNYGVALYSTATGGGELFNLTTPYQLVTKRFLYFDLKLYTTKFKHIDIIITDEYNNIICYNNEQVTRTPRIFTGDLNTNNTYTVKARIKLTDGTETEYRTILKSSKHENTLISKLNIPYLNKQSYQQGIMLNGLTAQSSQEFYTGTILLGKQNTDIVYRYNIVNNKLVEKGQAFTLGGGSDISTLPYLNIVPLHNGRVLVDYSIEKVNEELGVSAFKVFEYNAITHEFTELHSIVRNNERYSTGVSASTAPMLNNKVYYIPSLISDNNDNLQLLTLMCYDTETNIITEISELPENIKRYGNLVKLSEDKLMFLGGVLERDIDVYEDIYTRVNNYVYTYTISTNEWETVGTLSDIIPSSVYNLQVYERRDNKIVLFNASPYGEIVKDQSVYTIDLTSYAVEKHDDTIIDDLPYQTSILLRRGDVLRISARALDPQKVSRYVSNTMNDIDIMFNNTVMNPLDLMIQPGTTVTIESPYVYNSVKVLGTTYEDSGLLRWVYDDEVREFTFRDLLVTRSRTDIIDHYLPNEGWDTITLLDGVDYTVTNALYVPQGIEHTATAPMELDEIVIGENGELTITY